uniref:E3 ubiquitin-protein ligase TRIM39-like n=1 Tax=Pristiophorus japonicus TaxID=55135 RepID=UPI00398E5610
MGSRESWTQEAICPTCRDFFTDPVTLECGHSFCRSCITQCWEKKEINSCPECREEFPEINLRACRALASLAEKARKFTLNPKEKESKLHLEEHQERLKLFFSVTLDVETAHQWLEVSEDLKSVRRTRARSTLTDTEKRFTAWTCVLGSEGFTSGRHYWEVEVAANRIWNLGVATESVERKGKVDLIPENGLWTIGRYNDRLSVNSYPRSPLPAGQIPGKVGVYLSYESGTVTFYSADTKSHLHTFTGNKFTEKLYPFFWPGDVNKWLRICSGSDPGL